MKTETSLIIEDTTWCVLLLGEMADYVSYILFNYILCATIFLHVIYVSLSSPALLKKKEIMSKVSARSTLC